MTITAARQFQQSLIVPGHKECPFEWAVTSQSLWGSAILKGHYATAEQTDTRSSQQSRVWHKNISLYPTFVINASTDIGIKKLPLGPCKRMKARRLWQAIEGPPANLDRRSSMACRADTSHANKAKLETCFTMPCDRCGRAGSARWAGEAKPLAKTCMRVRNVPFQGTLANYVFDIFATTTHTLSCWVNEYLLCCNQCYLGSHIFSFTKVPKYKPKWSMAKPILDLLCYIWKLMYLYSLYQGSTIPPQVLYHTSFVYNCLWQLKRNILFLFLLQMEL